MTDTIETLVRERDEARAQLAALRATIVAYEPAREATTWLALDAALTDTTAAAEAHDRRVRAAALREAADAWRDSSYVYKGRVVAVGVHCVIPDYAISHVQSWLRRRAGEIEKGDEYDKTIADCWRAKVAEVERERDEAIRDRDFYLAKIKSLVDSVTAK